MVRPTDHPDMTIDIEWDIKPETKSKKHFWYFVVHDILMFPILYNVYM